MQPLHENRAFVSSEIKPQARYVLVRLGALTTVHLPGPTRGLGEWMDSNCNETR